MNIAAESHADRAKLAPRPIMSATSRAKVSNGTRLLAGVDGRSATFRRFRDLVADLIREQDRDLSISEIGLIRSAAALLVRSEELQAAAVRNEDLDGDELIRLTSEARRLLQLLRRSALPEPEPLTLEQHLRAVEAEEARQKREPAGRGRTIPRQRNATGGRGRPPRRASCDDEEG